MDLDLQTELRLSLKKRGVPAMLRLGENGYYFEVWHCGKSCRIGIPDSDEPVILEMMDDVSESITKEEGQFSSAT